MTAIYFGIFVMILTEILTSVNEFHMLKSNIDIFFCDVVSLLARIFIISSNRESIIRGVYKTKLKIFYGSVFVI